MQYKQDGGAVIPVRIHTIVISVQHDEDISLEDMRRALLEKVIQAVVPAKYLDKRTIYHLQPSGRFVIGGPQVRPSRWPWSTGSPVDRGCKGVAEGAFGGEKLGCNLRVPPLRLPGPDPRPLP